MPPDFTLRTARLVLRPVLEGESAEALAELTERAHGGPRVPARIAEARRVIAQSTAAFRHWGYGLWLLMEGGSEAIGWCGLKTGGDPGNPELMFGLVPPARGSGFATEATRAVIGHALSLPRTRTVWGAALPQNAASGRVMQRAGLFSAGRRILDGQEYAVYSTPAR